MFGRFTRPLIGAPITIAVVACFILAGELTRDSDADVDAPVPDVTVMVGQRPVSPPLPPGFVGLSLEFPALPAYAGRNPRAVNPVFEQLVRNLAPGQEPVLRLGGDSADVSWVPTPGLPRPRGASYSVGRAWLGVARSLAERLRAHLIIGVDLQAGSPALAAAEARAFMKVIGRRHIQALEIGNEGNRYPKLPWYRTATRRPVYARRRGYGFASFAADFARARRQISGVPLAGPTVGGFAWLSGLGGFLAGEPGVRVATFHRYPLDRCFSPPGSVHYPTIAHLLSARASRGLVAGMGRYVALAHRRGVAFRVDEMNSVACGGKFGISDTFASALWALDAVFSIAGAGADGVNVHTFPGAAYQLFTIGRSGGRWWASVRPEYYGLMMFARAAPAGARLVDVQLTGPAGVRVWATRATGGQERVVLINSDTAATHVVRLTGAARPGPRTTATIERLRAPSATATAGVRLGGRSFGRRTWTGILVPVPSSLTPASDGYTVTLPPASAALVTVAGR